ncbi:hypothetical protein HPQ64_11555 [Rhizobiales bacterium]|uniref:hypothetical protein n=1 Tax=Hongsoonwoonella zoysiae TaxID=2821844 RepID=UPI00155FEB0E|nr:hypothetical protein [Hongsoonwoonella zoysiae]NRG18325.1 hypothetical protein [Hongsoonwoonella zoysiae]
MKINDVIEIASNGGHAPAGLIRAIYRASQFGQIALVLHDIERQSVDQILDPVVGSLPTTIPGVVYIDYGDEDRLREAVCSANFIFASTHSFRKFASNCGVDTCKLFSVDCQEMQAAPHLMNGYKQKYFMKRKH